MPKPPPMKEPPPPPPPVMSPTAFSTKKKPNVGGQPIPTFLGSEMQPNFAQMGSKTLLGT